LLTPLGLLLNTSGVCVSPIEKFVDIGVLLLDCRDGVDISDVPVVGVGTADSVFASGNFLKID
jgi:hypothetical protein